MVFIPPNTDIPKAIAYLMTSVSKKELDDFKQTWERASAARFNPMLELKIVQAPTKYLGKSHEHIRAEENAAGRDDPFVIIDENIKRGAVWYIDQFATEEEVEDGEVESTKVLWKILIKVKELPISRVNYDIANNTISEDLSNCDIEFPLVEGYQQLKPHPIGEDEEDEEWEDEDEDDPGYGTDVWVTAEPGEFEESTAKELLSNFMPQPKKVARLKADVAKANGLNQEWGIPNKAMDIELPDGTVKKFPKGSVVLHTTYDPAFAWPAYQWPRGSL